MDDGSLGDDWDLNNDADTWRPRMTSEDPFRQYLAALDEYEDQLADHLQTRQPQPEQHTASMAAAPHQSTNRGWG